MIFKYVVGGRTIGRFILPHGERDRPRERNLSILRVCRQIYTETMLLVFRANTFTVCSWDIGELFSWLKSRLPIELEVVTSIELEMREMYDSVKEAEIGINKGLAELKDHFLSVRPGLKVTIEPFHRKNYPLVNRYYDEYCTSLFSYSCHRLTVV